MMVLDQSVAPPLVLVVDDEMLLRMRAVDMVEDAVILVSGKLTRANIDIPAESRFFGKPLAARQMIAEMQSMIGHA